MPEGQEATQSFPYKNGVPVVGQVRQISLLVPEQVAQVDLQAVQMKELRLVVPSGQAVRH